MNMNTAQKQVSKVIPQKGDTVGIMHRSNGNESKPKVEKENFEPTVSRVTAVYLDPFTVKVGSGEVWEVKPSENSKYKWETVR